MEFFYGLALFLLSGLILFLPLSFAIRVDIYYVQGIKKLSLAAEASFLFLKIWKLQRQLSDDDPRLGLWDTMLLFWLERHEKVQPSSTEFDARKSGRKRSIYAFILHMQARQRCNSFPGILPLVVRMQ